MFDCFSVNLFWIGVKKYPNLGNENLINFQWVVSHENVSSKTWSKRKTEFIVSFCTVTNASSFQIKLGENWWKLIIPTIKMYDYILEIRRVWRNGGDEWMKGNEIHRGKIWHCKFLWTRRYVIKWKESNLSSFMKYRLIVFFLWIRLDKSKPYQ